MERPTMQSQRAADPEFSELMTILVEQSKNISKAIAENLLVKTATQDLEKKAPIYRDFRMGDVRHSQANIDKAQVLLGYQPKYSISEGMDEAIDWYIKHHV